MQEKLFVDCVWGTTYMTVTLYQMLIGVRQNRFPWLKVQEQRRRPQERLIIGTPPRARGQEICKPVNEITLAADPT